MQFLALSSPYSHLAIFLGSIPISTFWARMAVFMGKACSGLHLDLRHSNWRWFSGTRSLRCSFQKVKSLRIWSTCLCHGLRLVEPMPRRAPFGFQCLLWPQDPARRGRGTDNELRGFAPIGMLEYWNNGWSCPEQREGGEMGSGLFVKFFLTWKIIIILIDEKVPHNINIPLFQHSIIPCARQKLKPQKTPLFSISCRISETFSYAS